MLLSFAAWTLAVLLFTVGVHRWSHILLRKAEVKSFRADEVHGPQWYRRAMRAHANCVENLPVFGVVVFAVHVSGAGGAGVNLMAAAVLCARILQSIVHVVFTQTNLVASIRFAFFFVQFACFVGLIATVVTEAL
jgi:uncharacterized MAPEG superfamily protein